MPRYTHEFLVSLREQPPRADFAPPTDVLMDHVNLQEVRSTLSKRKDFGNAGPAADHFSAEDRAKLEEIQRLVRKQLPRIRPLSADGAEEPEAKAEAAPPPPAEPVHLVKKKKKIAPKVVEPADVMKNVSKALSEEEVEKADVRTQASRELSPPELLGGCLDDNNEDEDGKAKRGALTDAPVETGPSFFQWAPFGPAPFFNSQAPGFGKQNGVFADISNKKKLSMPGFDGVAGAKGAHAASAAMAAALGLSEDTRKASAPASDAAADSGVDLDDNGLNPNAKPFVSILSEVTDENGQKVCDTDEEDELTPPWGSDIELPPPPAAGKNKRIETDKWRLRQRQKQIRIGLQTVGYKNFLRAKEIGFQVEVEQPRIPNVYQVCSKRAWDGQIRRWRQLLHKYDALTDVLWSEDEAKQVHQITEKHQKFKEKVRRQQLIEEITRGNGDDMDMDMEMEMDTPFALGAFEEGLVQGAQPGM
eukprot:TRINITY_DN6561_c0_g2_i1.p2 TRINITY_DN6561_c0_g2~~TRINITY_DN6561_c0_g2_i1.p2  ORF type:complete len:475 (+),score=226.77 TRINITY_DN6561_c0_g2_i1:132-1556(+)